MNKIFRVSFFAVLACIIVLFFSCKTVPQVEAVLLSREITGKSVLSSSCLVKYFMAKNPVADEKKVSRLANYYISEAKAENINSDVAFAQMCLETGYLTFGNLVTPEMNNFCGLGAMDALHPGEWFPTEQLGVRAHIQHLHAYGTTEDIQLHNDLVDNRYKWVRPRGKAPDIFGLAGTWATDKAYSEKLDRILNDMGNYAE